MPGTTTHTQPRITDPAQLARRVLYKIRTHPGQWNQRIYSAGMPRRVPVNQVRALTGNPDCGTTACVAGWAALYTVPDDSQFTRDDVIQLPDGTCRLVDNPARKGLGLNHDDADWLFEYSRSLEQVLAALESLAASQPMVRLPDNDAT